MAVREDAPPREVVQLGFDGDSVLLAALKAHDGLTPRQRLLIRMLRSSRGVRSSEAGRMMHETREEGACPPGKGKGLGCCQYAASDGLAALQRLEKRGLARRVRRGVWMPVPRREEW